MKAQLMGSATLTEVTTLGGEKRDTVERDDDWLSTRDVRRELPVSDVTLWRMVREGRFPKPAKIGNRKFWRRGDIRTWKEAQFADAA